MLVGGGRPYFPQHGHRVNLELIEARTFDCKVLYVRYRVVR